MAVALSLYEDGICAGCGQQLKYAMDPALADYWTTMLPARDHACTALAVAQETVKDEKYPHAIRHVVGTRAGWEDALAASGREGVAAEQ